MSTARRGWLYCTFCRVRLGGNDGTVARLVSGWTYPRKGGGVNALHLMTEPQAYAHKLCLEREEYRIKEGVVKGQMDWVSGGEA